MKPRALFLVLVAVVAAFALGSAGTAGAGTALSKGAVKKIAAKVIKKAAPSLAVASAHNADQLDGLDSADLKTTTYRLTLATTAVGSFQQQGFPGVPAGTYLATYDAVLSTGAMVDCALVPSISSPGVVVARAYSSSSGGSQSTASSSAALTVGNQTAIRCASASAFQFTSGEVTLTKIDTLRQGATTPVV